MSINHNGTNGGVKPRRSTESRMDRMQNKMDREAERVLHDIDTNSSRGHHSNSGLRPLVPSVAKNSIPRGYHGNGEFGKRYLLNIERMSDKETADSGDDDSYINMSSHTIDEELKRPIYATCPDTGRKIVKMQFDVHGFESSDIRVKISNRKLIIFALHRENDSGRKSTTEYCRRLKLPDDADVEQLQCTFQNSVLTIEAPAKQKEEAKVIMPVTKEEPLNTPFLKQSDIGMIVHVLVEVGTLFKADDVVVKLKGAKRLVVLAERHENEDKKATLSATLRREFELPDSINPASLKAGLTHDGILNVSAMLQEHA